MSRTRRFLLMLLGAALILMPASARAKAQHHTNILITKNSHFDKAHGVRSGKGTVSNPYVISGWDVNNITIKNTNKAFRIENNDIFGTLTLDWVGSNVQVHRNNVGDLRVNQNVKRTGEPTAGMIMHNTFNSVSQIRHFDGHFAYNTVGTPDARSWTQSRYPDRQVVNFDGFNGAVFERNTLYGYLTARLHGHHHASGYTADSHMHSGEHAMHDGVDHATRYHSVTIRNNKVYSGGPHAIEYVDTNHAGNDRTATSETNKALNKIHVHHTRIAILNNTTYGGGIVVNEFNATDSLHKKWAWGTMRIEGNRIDLSDAVTKIPNEFTLISADGFIPLNGIEVHSTRWMQLAVRNNTITWSPNVDDDLYRSAVMRTTGIMIDHVNSSNLLIQNNHMWNVQRGVWAQTMNDKVFWRVTGLHTHDVAEPLVYDSSVKNKPKRS